MPEKRTNYLYAIQCKNYIKFGVSYRPEERIKELQTGNPYKLSLLLKLEYENHFETEKIIHKYSHKNHELGEWFSVDDDLRNFVKYLKNIEYELSKR